MGYLRKTVQVSNLICSIIGYEKIAGNRVTVGKKCWKFILIGFHVLTGLVMPYTGGMFGNSSW